MQVTYSNSWEVGLVTISRMVSFRHLDRDLWTEGGGRRELKESQEVRRAPDHFTLRQWYVTLYLAPATVDAVVHILPRTRKLKARRALLSVNGIWCAWVGLLTCHTETSVVDSFGACMTSSVQPILVGGVTGEWRERMM